MCLERRDFSCVLDVTYRSLPTAIGVRTQGASRRNMTQYLNGGAHSGAVG